MDLGNKKENNENKYVKWTILSLLVISSVVAIITIEVLKKNKLFHLIPALILSCIALFFLYKAEQAFDHIKKIPEEVKEIKDAIVLLDRCVDSALEDIKGIRNVVSPDYQGTPRKNGRYRIPQN